MCRANPEARQDAIEIFPVQHVELAERRAARAHLFQRRLVLLAPGIGEGAPVELVSAGAENALGLACPLIVSSAPVSPLPRRSAPCHPL